MNSSSTRARASLRVQRRSFVRCQYISSSSLPFENEPLGKAKTEMRPPRSCFARITHEPGVRRPGPRDEFSRGKSRVSVRREKKKARKEKRSIEIGLRGPRADGLGPGFHSGLRVLVHVWPAKQLLRIRNCTHTLGGSPPQLIRDD